MRSLFLFLEQDYEGKNKTGAFLSFKAADDLVTILLVVTG